MLFDKIPDASTFVVFHVLLKVTECKTSVKICSFKVARAYSKFLTEVPYFLLFYSLQKVNQIGRKK